MWIRMKVTHVGAAGIFVNGLPYDLPEATVSQIPKKCYEKTCPPWEVGVDQEAVKLAESRQSYEIAKATSNRLASETEELRQRADSFVKPVADAQAKVKAAEGQAFKAVQIAEKKKATDDQKRRAVGLAREHEKAAALCDIAFCNMRTLLAQATLKRLEAEDADKQTRQLADQLGIVTDNNDQGNPAEAKPADPAADDVEPERSSVPAGDQPEVQDKVTE